MLQYIKPEFYDLHGSTIESFLRLLKVYQSFSLSAEEKEKATYLVAKNEEYGVYGGAVLYQQKVCDLYDKVGKVVSIFQDEKQEAWTARLCICIRDDDAPYTIEIFNLCNTFYKTLLKAFTEFGQKENINFLVLTLSSNDYYKVKRSGYGTSIVEIKDGATSDGYYHCFLAIPANNVYESTPVKGEEKVR